MEYGFRRGPNSQISNLGNRVSPGGETGGHPRRLCWWKQVLDYAGEEEGGGGTHGGLRRPSVPRPHPTHTAAPPARRDRNPRSPVALMDDAEEEAFDALMAAAHFHD